MAPPNQTPTATLAPAKDKATNDRLEMGHDDAEDNPASVEMTKADANDTTKKTNEKEIANYESTKSGSPAAALKDDKEGKENPNGNVKDVEGLLKDASTTIDKSNMGVGIPADAASDAKPAAAGDVLIGAGEDPSILQMEEDEKEKEKEKHKGMSSNNDDMVVDGVAPLPTSSLSRQTPVQLFHTANPGAYAASPGEQAPERRDNISFGLVSTSSTDFLNNTSNSNNSNSNNGVSSAPDESIPRSTQVRPEEPRLSEARPVNEDDLVLADLEQAEQVEPKEHSEARPIDRTKELLVIAVMVLSIAVIVLAVLLGIAMADNNDEDNLGGSGGASALFDNTPTEAPTLAPTSAWDYFLSGEFLPEYSMESLQDVTTPQWKASEWLRNHPELPDMPTWRKLQLFTLVTFYYAMDGDNWPQTIKDNWLLYERSECYWFSSLFGFFSEDGEYLLDETAVVYTSFASQDVGEPCNEDGRFQTLILQNLGLNESKPFLPRELELLTSLAFMSLQQNQINVSMDEFVPREVFQMQTIQLFHFFDNDLGGTIPTELGLMGNVSQLDLGDNELAGTIPSELGLMTSMTELHLYGNSLTGQIPSEVGLLTNMDEVTMHRTSLSGTLPTEIGLWGKVVRFHLGPSTLSGPLPSELGLMTSLVDFSLSENSFTGSLPSEIAMMTSLQVLRLKNNSLSGTLPQELSRMVVDGSIGLLSLEDNAIIGTIPEGLCVLGESLLTFDCSSELCGCCWCSCSGEGNNNTECNTDLSLNPLFGEWPGAFPSPIGSSNVVTINIRTDDWEEETSWTWSVLDDSDTWQILESGNPPNATTLFSYAKELNSSSLYRLQLFDSYGDGNCCGWGFGWFSITNSTPSPEHANGTVIWGAVGDVLDGGKGVLEVIDGGTSLDIFLSVDNNGNTQQVEFIEGQGYGLQHNNGSVTIVVNSSGLNDSNNATVAP